MFAECWTICLWPTSQIWSSSAGDRNWGRGRRQSVNHLCLKYLAGAFPPLKNKFSTFLMLGSHLFGPIYALSDFKNIHMMERMGSGWELDFLQRYGIHSCSTYLEEWFSGLSIDSVSVQAFLHYEIHRVTRCRNSIQVPLRLLTKISTHDSFILNVMIRSSLVESLHHHRASISISYWKQFLIKKSFALINEYIATWSHS